jgi:hypothetical protein
VWRLITEQKLFINVVYNNEFLSQILFPKYFKQNFTFNYVDISDETFFVFACLMNKIVCCKNKNLALLWNHKPGSQNVFQVVTETNNVVSFCWIMTSGSPVEHYQYFAEKYACSVRVSDCIISHWNFSNHLRNDRTTKSLLADGYEVS